MEANKKFVLSSTAALDADTIKDCLHAEKLGFKVVFRPVDDPRERPKAVVAPREVLGNAPDYGVLARLAEQAGQVLRWEGEQPAVSIELARARGFSDEEIAEHLQPWRAQGVALSE